MPASFENVSPMLSNRLKPENHSPNELKRSSSDFVEAMNSHVSGMTKYTRNASMNSVGNTKPLSEPGAPARLRTFTGVAAAPASGVTVGTALIVPPACGRVHDQIRHREHDDPEQERQGGRVVEALVGEREVEDVEVRRVRLADHLRGKRIEDPRLGEQLEGADHREDRAQ